MRPQRDYYEILGLPSSASMAEIKKRYRELARQFHPDVAGDKSVGHRAFTQIIEAYQTLSDPDKRRSYDASRLRPEPRSAPRPSAGQQRPSYQPRGPSRPQPGPARPADPGRFVREAEFAFIRGRMNEAASLCRRAIAQNRANARAHAILGDIYRIQGKKEQAILEYTYAVQFDPRDQDSQTKLEKLIQPRGGRRRPAPETVRRRARAVEEYAAEMKSAANVANIVGWGICFFLLFLVNIYHGEPIRGAEIILPMVSTWSWNLIALLALDSALAAFLLTVNKLVDHPDEELLFQHLPGTMIPIGPPLLIFSFISFYIAAGVTLALNYLQGASSKSLLRIFVAVIALTFGAALMYEPGRLQVLLHGGNVAFPAALFGWYIGSLFAPFEK